MGAADGRKVDLFDRIGTSSRSGQMDLSDNRKRKADALGSPGRWYDGHGRASYKKPYSSSSLDLGAMLHPDGISQRNYKKIQGVLFDQDRKIQNLNREVAVGNKEIKLHCDEISSLHKRIQSLERENERLREEKDRHAAASKNTMKQMREKRESLQNLVKEKDDFLAMGTKAVKDKTETARRLEDENARLRQTVTDRDTMVTKLNEQLWKVTCAPLDERTDALLQTQAANTLSMVNGLKADVQCRDERIRDLEGQVKDFDGRVVRMNGVIRGSNQVRADSQREVEGVKRELKKQREVAESAAKRATHAREVAEQQERLIGRILEENKRLCAGGSL